MATTLAQFRTRSRQRADQELGIGQDPDTHFISDTELNTYINASAQELYDLLIAATDQDYYLTFSLPTIVNNATEMSLPTDFYKFKELERKESSDDDTKYRVIRKFNFNERNRGGLRYRVVKDKILMSTQLSGGDVYRLWYNPKMTVMSSDSDSFDGINGWEEYVVIDAAIKMMNKEESDPSALMSEKSAIMARIQAMAERDIGEPDRITDRRRDGTISGIYLDEYGWEYYD
jgi:hypothetical protein